MDGNENYGLIIKLLRQKSKLSVRGFAESCGRSIGWLSEVENGKGLARLSEVEFDRLVELLGATAERSQFKTWVANYKNAERIDRGFDGAVLKYIRIKKGLRLKEVAASTGYSIAHLSRIELGVAETSAELRNSYMVACGYSPGSFKNLSSDPIRSRAVPLAYKLEILLKKLPKDRVEEVFAFTQNLIGAGAR